MLNSVSKGFVPFIRAGSSRRFQWYPNTHRVDFKTDSIFTADKIGLNDKPYIGMAFIIDWRGVYCTWNVLLFDGVCHEFLFCALRAYDVVAVGDESFPNHRSVASRADETSVVPIAALERDETGTTNACDWLWTCCTPLGKELTEALCAIWFVFSWREPLSSEWFLTVGTSETFTMPRLVPVSHTSLGYHFVTLDAFSCKLVLVALCAIDVVVLGYERLGPDRVLASAAHKTPLVPLPSLVFHFLHACPENVPTCVAPGGELSVVAWPTINPVSLGSELFVHQGSTALGTNEARLVPMLVFVREILWINTNDFGALVTVVGEDILVTFYTIGVIIPENVSVSC